MSRSIRHERLLIASLSVLVATASLSGCAPAFPESPTSIGANYPSTGIPTDVAWPSDWLDGFVGESEATGGPIVGLTLEYVDDTWVWRIRSLDPNPELTGAAVRESKRGRESLVDASTLALLTHREVQLTEAELAELSTSYFRAAQMSGEEYPSPRLVGLQRVIEDDRASWKITTYDTEIDTLSVAILGSTSAAVE